MKTVERKGGFIKQFVGAGENEIVCFKFWQAVIASGCPGKCSYCFLQTQYPYRTGLYEIEGTLFENLHDIVPEARKWLKSQKQPASIILGENQDGLAFEGPYKKLLGATPLELLIPLFEVERDNPHGHTLIVLSKFTSTQWAENFGPQKNVVYSWSLSLPTISERYEKGVASLTARLRKAGWMKLDGYRVRFRLDALAPIDNWRNELTWIVEQINDIKPEMLTIGALRASNASALRRAAESNGRDASIFDYIQTVDPSGFKARTEDSFHTEAFQLIKEQLHPSIVLGLCKEDLSMWNESGVEWQGCHCLHGAADSVTTPRLHLLERTRVRSFPESRESL
jgi:DNA repair photolyase